MKPDKPIDYAVFQLSPRRSRCELFISGDGNTEKIASGLVKPFVAQLKFVEEQVASAAQSIKLKVERTNAESWFTKGTLERFVRFVSTPDVLESISTLDVEMTQLEAARKIYSQGAGDQISGMSGADGTGTLTAADATKKELLRAIDVRLVAVRQDLTTACARASAAGFNPDTVCELQFFANCFAAHRLNEACTKFISLHQRRSDLLKHWKPTAEKQDLRASCDSDMSIDDPDQDQHGLQYEPQLAKIRDSTGMQVGTVQKIQQLSDQSQPSKSFTTIPLQCPAKTENCSEQGKQEDLPSEPSSSEINRAARRLSVQDRINLFENKQKENSGGKSTIVKPAEPRRLSSDVTPAATPTGVADKTVLRRWSGASSDMSIDSSGSDKKDNADFPVCMPFSSTSLTASEASLHPVESQESKGLNDTQGSEMVDVNTASDRTEHNRLRYRAEVQPQQETSLKHKEVESKEMTDLKTQEDSQRRFGSYGSEITSEQAPAEKVKVYSNATESDGSKYIASSGTMLKGSPDRTEPVMIKNQTFPLTSVGGSITEGGDAVIECGAANRVEDVGVYDHACIHNRVSQGHAHLGQLDGGFDFNIGEAHNRTSKGYQLSSKPRWKSNLGEAEFSHKGLVSYEKQPSKIQRMKQKTVAVAPVQVNKYQAKRDEEGHCSSNPAFPGNVTSDGQVSSGVPSKTPLEHVQIVREPKGNQNLNDELKMKANELEKLFAEHQLCVPGDQSTSARRKKLMYNVGQKVSKPGAAEMASVKQIENDVMSTPPDNVFKFSNDSKTRLEATPDHSSNLLQKYSDVGFLHDSRGKFYDKYMQKRDAKLREEWSTKRPEKEAKLKAMQDSFERSRAEIEAKLSGSVDRQDSKSSSCRRVQRLKSFDIKSAIKMGQSEEDEDKCGFLEHQPYGQDKLFSEEVAYRSTRSKKTLPSRNSAYVTPRTSASISRSSVALNSIPGKRRLHSGNDLAQSVSYSSDLRGENVKASGVGKMMTRVQISRHARSKSSMEEAPHVREEKPQRSHSLRRSSSGIQEFGDACSLISDGIALESDGGWTQNSCSSKLMSMESKHLMMNNTGKSFISVAKMSKKASHSAERLNDDAGEHDDSTFEEERRKEEEDDLESMDVDDFTLLVKGKPRTSAVSSKLNYFVSDFDESLLSFSQAGLSSVGELPASVPSACIPVESLQDPTGEYPVSWNSRMHQQHLSNFQETSDVDVSVHCPIGSPASLNSHMLNQPEADVARMRKKWGSAQKSILVANSSQNQFSKDTPKGFKRLLKFGKKNRGTENMADWISATTSEGDDDSEDIHDPTFPSSENLRKSRMGFSLGHPDNGINENELLSEGQTVPSSIPVPPANFKLREDLMSGTSIKAPKSIFSLSSFRSKGSDSKLR